MAGALQGSFPQAAARDSSVPTEEVFLIHRNIKAKLKGLADVIRASWGLFEGSGLYLSWDCEAPQ